MARADYTTSEQRKKRSTGIKKMIGRGLLLGMFFFLVYIFLFGDYGAYRIWKQKREIAQLEQTVEALRLKQERLKKEIDLLQNDPEYVEKIAREEYGMVREGEIIYRIISAPEGEGEGGKGDSSIEEKP